MPRAGQTVTKVKVAPSLVAGPGRSLLPWQVNTSRLKSGRLIATETLRKKAREFKKMWMAMSVGPSLLR